MSYHPLPLPTGRQAYPPLSETEAPLSRRPSRGRVNWVFFLYSRGRKIILIAKSYDSHSRCHSFKELSGGQFHHHWPQHYCLSMATPSGFRFKRSLLSLWNGSSPIPRPRTFCSLYKVPTISPISDFHVPSWRIPSYYYEHVVSLYLRGQY